MQRPVCLQKMTICATEESQTIKLGSHAVKESLKVIVRNPIVILLR